MGWQKIEWHRKSCSSAAFWAVAWGLFGSMQAVLEKVVSEDEAVLGVVCNDANGLCLGTAGETFGGKPAFLTSLVRRAALLGVPSLGDKGTPMVVIESEEKRMLVKDYDSLTVAITKSIEAE
uniref:Late endosomal/lysosomal adaptor and MAPK and MTOR activator 5 n=1 Tax=Pinguiococcus pyrenoidosus TaxID=172671 RepID=A0A7R9YDN0_9STRA